MQISIRSATLEDLVAAQPALEACYGPDPGIRRRLPEAWSHFLKLEGTWAAVVEDTTDYRRPRLVHHGMSTLISNRFALEIMESGCPFIGAQLVRRYLERGDEPLTVEEIRAGHAGEGISLMNVHSMNLLLPGEPPSGVVAEKVYQSNFSAMRGYRLAYSLREVHSLEGLKAYSSGGWHLRSKYGAESDIPSLAHPFLLSVDRPQMEEAAGARMSALYTDYPTRLRLKRTHRELLALALTGMTDEEMADELSLSGSAVKKRWRSVYERVDERAPGLLPSDPLRPESGRGAERRRHLLNYLRDHPEEMRPLED